MAFHEFLSQSFIAEGTGRTLPAVVSADKELRSRVARPVERGLRPTIHTIDLYTSRISFLPFCSACSWSYRRHDRGGDTTEKSRFFPRVMSARAGKRCAASRARESKAIRNRTTINDLMRFTVNRCRVSRYKHVRWLGDLSFYDTPQALEISV